MNHSTSQVSDGVRLEKELGAVITEVKGHSHTLIHGVELVEWDACKRANDAHPHQRVEEIKVSIYSVTKHQEWLLDQLGLRLWDLDVHLFQQGFSEAMSEIRLMILPTSPEDSEKRVDDVKLGLGSHRMHVLNVLDSLVDLLNSKRSLNITFRVFEERLEELVVFIFRHRLSKISFINYIFRVGYKQTNNL